jgi:hypothetical protein
MTARVGTGRQLAGGDLHLLQGGEDSEASIESRENLTSSVLDYPYL